MSAFLATLPERQWPCRQRLQFDPLLGRLLLTGSISSQRRLRLSAANCLAMSAPIPFEAPVTTAIFPFNFPFFIVFLSFFVFGSFLLFLH